MPAPTVYTYSAGSIVAAHTSFRDRVDSGAGPGQIRLRNAADALLGTITLTDPCGTVNGTTGQLTLTQNGQQTATTQGTVAYGEVTDSTGTVHLSLPVEAGTSPVSGKLVMPSLSLVVGSPLVLISATIG